MREQVKRFSSNVGTGSSTQSHGFLLPFVHITSNKELRVLKEGKSRTMSIEMEGQPRNASVSALAACCRREINNYRRGETHDVQCCLELFHRARVQHDDTALEVLRQCFSGITRDWMRSHPKKEVVCRFASEEYYVAQAFERFWQAVVQQEREFSTLAAALGYLQASLNGVILDTLRTYSQSSKVPSLEPDEAEEPVVESYENGGELWEIIQSILPNEREQRVAYLLFHCGLQPREIVRYCPQEFSNVQEISHLRRNIIEQLMRSGVDPLEHR